MTAMALPRPAKVKAAAPPVPLVAPQPLLWTCKEFQNLGESGMLGDRKFMLIDGVIVEKPMMNRAHAKCVEKLNVLLVMLFGLKMRMRCQLPLNLNELNDPEPDFAISKGLENIDHPETAELIIEVSDSTFDIDYGVKRERYAQARIPEYWIVDLNKNRLLVFRDPDGESYQSQVTLTAADTVSPLSLPTATITVGDLLP